MALPRGDRQVGDQATILVKSGLRGSAPSDPQVPGARRPRPIGGLVDLAHRLGPERRPQVQHDVDGRILVDGHDASEQDQPVGVGRRGQCCRGTRWWRRR